MDIPPKNEFVSLSVLEEYIEKYPEDAEKWLEFIKDPAEEELRRRRNYVYHEMNNEILEETINRTLPSDTPVTCEKDGCLFCKKSWVSTETVPTTTLICNHKFHTTCSMLDQYSNDYVRCIVEGCTIDTWAYIRAINTRMERNQHKAEDLLLNTIQKRSDFKEEVKELKGIVSSVSGKHGTIRTLMANARRDFLHKHHCTINQLQTEMNQNIEFIRKSQQMVDYKSAISLYRKKAGHIFRNYHMSFRDMRERRLIKVSRNLRWILERHRNPFSFYRLGLRIYPGKKMWKDPLV